MAMLLVYIGVPFLVLFVIFWYKFAYAPYQVFKKIGLPSPPVVPFFGNSLDILKLGDIGAIEKWMKKYGKTFGYYIGAQPYIVVLDPNMIKEVTIKQFDNFTERRKDVGFLSEIRNKANIVTGLLVMGKKDWKRIRPIVSPTFSAKKMRTMMSLIEKNCLNLDEIFSDICTKGNTELLRIFGQFTMETILATAFGFQVEKDEDRLTKAASEIFTGSNAFAIVTSEVLCSQICFSSKVFGFFFARKVKLARFYAITRVVALEMIEQRRQQSSCSDKNVDFLQLLMEAKAEDTTPGSKQLTDDEIVSLCITFLLAGYETTSNLLAFTAYLLAMNPDKQDKLVQEIKDYYQENKDSSLHDASQSIQYLDWVLKESLRIYPPGPRTYRICDSTCTVNGVTIPEGCGITIPMQILHNSVEHWDHPESFIPERFSPDEKESRHPLCYMPFGSGPRNCIGMRFAMMEAKMCLMSLLRKYKFERGPDTQVPLQTCINITQSPADGIIIKVVLNE